MKNIPGSPRRLPHVLQAIQDLGDTHGSTTKKILGQLESARFGIVGPTKSTSDKPKNLTTEVRKALKYAIDNGIVRERAGKFSMVGSFRGAGTRKVVAKADPNKSIFDCRRRRRRSVGHPSRRRRRRHRRHASLSSLSDSALSAASNDNYENNRDRSLSGSRSRSPLCTDAAGIITARRHGHHHHSRRRRRRSRRGGHHGHHGHHSRRRRRRGRKHSLNYDDGPEDRKCSAHQVEDCHNPGCQKERDDEDKRDSYIN